MHDDDGLQAARIGVLQAVRRFDPERGTRFSTYAAFWIRAEIELERADRQIVGISPAAMLRRRRVLAAQSQLGCASAEDLAAAAQVSVDQVRALEALGGLEVRELWGGGRLYLEERLAGSTVALDEQFELVEQLERLDQALAKLATNQPRLARIIEGRLAGETLGDLGDELGISRERVRQLEVRAHAWLRKEVRR